METVLGFAALAAIVWVVLLLKKAQKAATRAVIQKVVYRKKFEQGKHLLEGFTVETTASASDIMRQLESRVVVADPPTGLANRLYVAARTDTRIDYVYGNRIQNSFRASVVLFPRDGGTTGVFDVAQWHETEGIVVAQDWVSTLFEHVKAAIVAADPDARIVAGSSEQLHKAWATAVSVALPKSTVVSRAPDRALAGGSAVQEPAHPAPSVEVAPIAGPDKRTELWRYAGIIISAGSLFAFAFDPPGELVPVLVITLAIGLAISYFANRPSRQPAPVSSARRPAAAPQAQFLPGSAFESAAPAEVAEVPEPSPEEFAAPVTADAVTVGLPQAWRTPSRILVGALALFIVGVVIAGVASNAPERGVPAETADAPAQEAGVAEVSSEPADSSQEFDFSPDQLLGYADEGDEPQYVDIVYAGGSEWYGGDVLLNFVATGLDGAPEFLIELPNSTPCFIDSRRVDFTEYYAATYEAGDHRGMIVFDCDAVRELHVFTQGQSASESLAGGESATGTDLASTEGDTASFVQFVQDEGGELLINAEMDGERVYSRPSIIAVRSSEPFFEWAIPLSDSYEYTIGDRSVTGYELFEYICEQGLVRIDVVCDDGRILSIHCWEE